MRRSQANVESRVAAAPHRRWCRACPRALFVVRPKPLATPTEPFTLLPVSNPLPDSKQGNPRAQRRGSLWRWAAALAVAGLVATVAWQLRQKLREPEKAPGFQPTLENKAPPPSPAPESMAWIPGGEFSMGSDVADESL